MVDKRNRLAQIEDNLRSRSAEARELELNMENYDAILGEYKATKESYKKQQAENARIKKEVMLKINKKINLYLILKGFTHIFLLDRGAALLFGGTKP